MTFKSFLMKIRSRRLLRVGVWVVGLSLLFALYTSGLRSNPPGFYMDESAGAYNAYLVATTGACETGPRFPLFPQFYTDSFTQTVDSLGIYLFAIAFLVLPPSILVARLYSAFLFFVACLLLGLLAKRISGRRAVGVIVTAMALLTPWIFEIRGLLLIPQVLLVFALFLVTLHHVQKKERWSWLDVAMLAATLALVTYCYSSGRLLGPIFALGLLFFATTRQRWIGVIKTGLLYGLTLIPLYLFNRQHPGALTKRLYEISYVKPGVPWSDVVSQFIKRYLEDQSITTLLLYGDYHPRHHVQGSGGAIFFATFILVLIGLAVVIACRWRDPWWRFVLLGLAGSIVPGAISVEPFHGLRLMCYPVFLLLMTIPALEWLLASKVKSGLVPTPAWEPGKPHCEDRQPEEAGIVEGVMPRAGRLCILFALLALTGVEAYWFQTVFRRDGPKRSYEFDLPYKAAYDAAVKQPTRPIYLADGKWGPGYIHALWYAAVEKRARSEFVHLRPGVKLPAGKVVISSAENCEKCETIMRSGVYHVYKSL